jgi:hypothetical protein
VIEAMCRIEKKLGITYQDETTKPDHDVRWLFEDEHIVS